MTSDNKSNLNNDTGISSLIQEISKAARSVEKEDAQLSLIERIDALELLVEEFAKAREFQSEVRNYVIDLREELGDLRNYRFWVTAFAWLLSVGFFALVFCLINNSPIWFANMDDHLQAPLIFALISGAVVIMVILLKGVYRSRQDRNHAEEFPAALTVSREAYRAIQN